MLDNALEISLISRVLHFVNLKINKNGKQIVSVSWVVSEFVSFQNFIVSRFRTLELRSSLRSEHWRMLEILQLRESQAETEKIQWKKFGNCHRISSLTVRLD